MKVEWQAEDVVPSRIVGKPDRDERWMIGCFVSSEECRYVLISLTNGVVLQPATAEMMALALNKAGYLPDEFFDRPARKVARMGGHARAAALTSERRSEIAAMAANVRWGGPGDRT